MYIDRYLESDKNLPGIIFVADLRSVVICHDYIDFSNTRINAFTFSTYYGDDNTNMFVVIKEDSFINITNNKGHKGIILPSTMNLRNKYVTGFEKTRLPRTNTNI